ncbi:MAG: hypothetical protein LUG54_10450 [Clostridiales bacterium]|nr:hypothetical protein [Clostridiales bacterium]
MDYQFDRHDPYRDKILFVLILDRAKMKERILIGTELEIRFRLGGSRNADVLCDVTRPLGTFLTSFEHDPDGQLNLHALVPLYNALHTNRWKQPEPEKAAGDFLAEKNLTGNPVSMYTAFRVWNDYLVTREYRDRDAASDRFRNKAAHLLLAFRIERAMYFNKESGQAGHLKNGGLFYRSTPDVDTRLDLWYPDTQRSCECVAAYHSFIPLITYYQNRLNDWGLCFRQCRMCRKYFLARSQRYDLCSDKCRKAQALQNKREFDERARKNSYDLAYKNETQNWRNKINKAKRTPDFPPDRLEEMQAAFDAFKKEALKRKTEVKKGTAAPKEFTDWLFRQSAIIVRLSENNK